MLAVVPNTIILESPSVAFISSLMREKRVGNVSSTVGITTEYCGTFSNVGGSDASMLIKSMRLAFVHKARLLNIETHSQSERRPFALKTRVTIKCRVSKRMT